MNITIVIEQCSGTRLFYLLIKNQYFACVKFNLTLWAIALKTRYDPFRNNITNETVPMENDMQIDLSTLITKHKTLMLVWFFLLISEHCLSNAYWNITEEILWLIYENNLVEYCVRESEEKFLPQIIANLNALYT